jgi:hypothetical protein
MKWEIRRIEPIRAANIAAVIYFILFAVVAAPMFYFGASAPQQNLDPAQQASAKRFIQIFTIAYPFLGAIFGWVMTAFGAVIYNALTPRLGGLLIYVGESSPQASNTVA